AHQAHLGPGGARQPLLVREGPQGYRKSQDGEAEVVAAVGMTPQEAVVGSVVDRWTTIAYGEDDSSPRVEFRGLVVDCPLTREFSANLGAASKLLQVPAWIDAGWRAWGSFCREIVPVSTTLGA